MVVAVSLAAAALFGVAPAAASANVFTFTELGAPAPYEPTAFNVGSAVLSADYNGDGHADLAVMNTDGYATCPGGGCVSVLLGHGDGTFSSPVNFDPGGCPFYGTASMAQGDLLGNGREDLVIANGGCFGSSSVTILYGKGDGTFAAPVTIPTGVGSGPEAVAVGDFNGDGRPDIAVANAGDKPQDVSILLNQGGGVFTPASGSPFALASSPSGSVYGMSVANLTGHGKVDLVLSIAAVAGGAVGLCSSIPCVQVLTNRNDGAGSFNPAVAYQVGGAGEIAAGDLRGTGKDDVVVPGSNGVDVLLNQGTGALGASTEFTYPGAIIPSGLALGDFNGDGKLDAAVADFDAGITVLFKGNGDGTFTFDDQIADPNNLQDTDNALVAASFINPCRLDLAVGTDSGVFIMRNDTPYTCPVPPPPTPPAPAPTPTPPPSNVIPSSPKPTPTSPGHHPYTGLTRIRLVDVPRSCTARAVTFVVEVTNRQAPQSTVVYLNGHVVARSKKLRFTVALPLVQISVGRDSVMVRTTSHGRSKTARGHFSRCAPVPRFTG